MAINFPTSLDNFTNNTDNVDTIVAQDVNDLNDAVEALEAKVGIDNSAVTTSIDYIIKNKIWPVGSVFTAVVSTNPATLLGFGTWSQIAGGNVLVGQTDGDSDFNVAEETGGAKTFNNAHTHTGPSHTHTGPSHTHTFSATSGSENNKAGAQGYDSGGDELADQSHEHTVSGTTGAGGTGATGAGGTGATGSSGSATQSIMNPYLVVYFFKRTA